MSARVRVEAKEETKKKKKATGRLGLLSKLPNLLSKVESLAWHLGSTQHVAHKGRRSKVEGRSMSGREGILYSRINVT